MSLFCYNFLSSFPPSYFLWKRDTLIVKSQINALKLLRFSENKNCLDQNDYISPQFTIFQRTV